MPDLRDEPNDHYSITTPHSLTLRLREIARRRGCGLATVIREALIAWVASDEQQQRRAS